jgi:hypothetical protein
MELDAVEKQLGTRLPQSYRDFMKRFGCGSLWHGGVEFYWLSKSETRRLDVVSFTRGLCQYVEESDRFPNPAWFAQLIIFAGDGSGAAYCWDPSSKTRNHPHEHPCFRLEHETEEHPIAAGRTFWEFIAWGAMNATYGMDHQPDVQRIPHIPFTPYQLRSKKAPTKKNVTLWLAYNHNTARDLALSIRDKRQTDAFPILADALEEAGCTNADLLDSCRIGDPDIDGVWVLQVLLGNTNN